MERAKLKNIVLFILVVTNLCLLVFVVRQELRTRRADAQARENAIAFLAERGIRVDEPLVPKEMDLLPQVVERDRDAEGKAAQALLKGDVEMESRGGEVYRYYNENGSVQFHSDGTFSAELAPGAYPLGNDREAACLAVLKQLDFSAEVVEEGESALVLRQTWRGVSLFSQQVTVNWEEGSIRSLTGGRRLMGQPEEDRSRSALTVSGALIYFFNGLNGLGDVCSRVDSIDQGYVSTVSLNAPVTLTPVWRVVTDTGPYQLDGVTGALTRLG